MQTEILALRHQLAVLQRRTNKRVSLRPLALGRAFATLGAVAHSTCHRQASNSNPLAARRVSFVLVLEEQQKLDTS
jgi:hypothetical protein